MNQTKTLLGDLINLSNHAHSFSETVPDLNYDCLLWAGRLSKPLPGSPNLTFLGCHVAEDLFASSLPGLRIILECSYRFDTKSPDKLKVFGGITFIDPDGMSIKAKHQDFVYPYDETKTLIGGKTIITKENLGDNNEKTFHISLFVPYGILERPHAPNPSPLESLFLLADLETIPENSEISEKKRQYYILNYSNKDVYSYQFLHPRNTNLNIRNQVYYDLNSSFLHLDDNKAAAKISFFEQYCLPPEKHSCQAFKQSLEQKIPIGAAIRYFAEEFLLGQLLCETQEKFNELYNSVRMTFHQIFIRCCAAASLSPLEKHAFAYLFLNLRIPPPFEDLIAMQTSARQDPQELAEALEIPVAVIQDLPQKAESFFEYIKTMGNPNSLPQLLNDMPILENRNGI